MFDRAVAAGLFAAAVFVAPVLPAAAHTAEEVQALVERAALHIQAVGREQAFADFTSPDGGYLDGDLYVFCVSGDGTELANGGNPKLVGKNLAGLRDSRGTLIDAEFNRVGRTQGRGWVGYFWPNQKTHSIQQKNSYVLQIDDQTICGSGYYIPGSK